jgi:hypothetical protein
MHISSTEQWCCEATHSRFCELDADQRAEHIQSSTPGLKEGLGRTLVVQNKSNEATEQRGFQIDLTSDEKALFVVTEVIDGCCRWVLISLS